MSMPDERNWTRISQKMVKYLAERAVALMQQEQTSIVAAEIGAICGMVRMFDESVTLGDLPEIAQSPELKVHRTDDGHVAVHLPALDVFLVFTPDEAANLALDINVIVATIREVHDDDPEGP